jgi:hypothetical protein
VVEPAETVEADLADSLGAQLAAGAAALVLYPVDDQLEVARIDVALVGGADQTSAELRPVEWLALAAPLDHLERLGLAALEAGESPPALAALAAAANGGAALGTPALEDARLGAA